MALGFALVTYESGGAAAAGIEIEGEVYAAAGCTGVASDGTVLGIVGDWEAARRRLAAVAKAPQQHAAHRVGKPHLLAPVLYPGTIYCAGANYADHVAEMNRAQNRAPDPDPRTLGLKSWHFIKAARTVVGPDAVVALPANAKRVDWEVELAAVIGKVAKNVPVERALDHVVGYTVANDLSARDRGPRPAVEPTSPFSHDWVAHKSFDGSCPMGPRIVPADDIADPQHLKIALSVNGVTKQDSNTAQMIFSLAEQIADLSEKCTLYPGDVVLTGTPAGVGAGRGEFLKPGDRVEARIEGIGTLITTIG